MVETKDGRLKSKEEYGQGRGTVNMDREEVGTVNMDREEVQSIWTGKR